MKNADNKMRLCNQKGFTILEVLTAVSILTIGLLGVASMQIDAIRGNYFSDNTTCALALAEDKMERLLGLTYSNDELKDNVTTNNTNLNTIVSGNVDHEELNIDEAGDNGGQFHRIWNIADNLPMSNNKTITVIVTWDQDKHRVSLSSIKRL